jgi:hypothetical protein
MDYDTLAKSLGGVVSDDYDAMASQLGGAPVDQAPDLYGSMESAEEIPGLDPSIDAAGQYVDPPAPKPASTLEDTLKGIDETLLAIGTGAITGAGAMVRGTLSQLAKEIADGSFGSPDAAQRIYASAMENAEKWTRTPRGPIGAT